MVHDDVLVVPRNLLICFMSSLSLCVLWLFGRSGGTGAQIPHVRLHGRCSKTELELCIAGMCICSMFGPALIFFLWGSKVPGRCRAVGVGNMRLTDRLAAVYCLCGHAMYGAGPLLAISVEPGRLVTVTVTIA